MILFLILRQLKLVIPLVCFYFFRHWKSATYDILLFIGLLVKIINETTCESNDNLCEWAERFRALSDELGELSERFGESYDAIRERSDEVGESRDGIGESSDRFRKSFEGVGEGFDEMRE